MSVMMRCPHCNSKSKVRTSRNVSAISRELYYQCQNINCGHTWKSIISIINTIVPSQCPNPTVFIPVLERNHAPAAPPSG